MRITITCEDCGHRHRLERTLEQPGEIWIVCHACEMPLRAMLEDAPTKSSGPSAAFAAVWNDTLDLRSGAERA